MKNSNDNRTRVFPACSAVPQLIPPPRAPSDIYVCMHIILIMNALLSIYIIRHQLQKRYILQQEKDFIFRVFETIGDGNSH